MIHELKILPKYYQEVISGIKTFEIRKNDRGYNLGDILHLREWDGKEYTGRESHEIVQYIFNGGNLEYGLMEGFCILGIRTASAADVWENRQ